LREVRGSIHVQQGPQALLSLVSRVQVVARENIPDGGWVAASDHPSNVVIGAPLQVEEHARPVAPIRPGAPRRASSTPSTPSAASRATLRPS
jgi:hypothetical protein